MSLRAVKRIHGLISSLLPSNYGILHIDPLIVLTSYRSERTFPFFHFKRLLRALPTLDIHFFFYLCSYLPQGDLNRLKKHRLGMDSDTARRVHFMTNTQAQLERITEVGYSGVFCSHNALIDENIFKPIKHSKRWCAVYDAQLHPIKRHDLARHIPNLVLTFPRVPRSQMKYARHIKSILSGATFANGAVGQKYSVLDPVDVVNIINQSQVGLCLSAREGAMYASVQYLLSGIPVVTTASIGGRDEFFDSHNSILVEDNPVSVAKGAQFFATQCRDPEIIRARTIQRIREHRERLFHYIEKIVPNSHEGYFAACWSSIFYNKLTVPDLSLAELLSTIHSVKKGINFQE
jgi:glycosyltransferase involved in cell wall biosynthesis